MEGEREEQEWGREEVRKKVRDWEIKGLERNEGWRERKSGINIY